MQTETVPKRLLHVGCGPKNPEALPPPFRTDEWLEIRLDINPDVQPDIIGTITDMGTVPDQSVDVVFSSHNIEHLYPHEVEMALKEFWRVLIPGGFAFITTPDIQAVAKHVAEGNLEDPLYQSPAGPIAAIDIFYGLRSALAKGNHFMAHKTGFTAGSFRQKLTAAGFEDIDITAEGLELCAVSFK